MTQAEETSNADKVGSLKGNLAVLIRLAIGSAYRIDFSEREIISATLLTGRKLSLKHGTPYPDEAKADIQPVLLTVKPFASLDEARDAGERLTGALLTLCISRRMVLELENDEKGLPYQLIDIYTSEPDVRGISHSSQHIYAADLLREIIDNCSKQDKLSADIMLAMELYAVARLERSYRAQFITMMTALEALSAQNSLPRDICQIIDDLAKSAEENGVLNTSENSVIRESLVKRIKELKRESVRQAILRTIADTFEDAQEKKAKKRFFDQVYGIRSKMLHEGLKSEELGSLIDQLDDLIRTVFSKKIPIELVEVGARVRRHISS